MDPLAPISRRLVAPIWASWERSPYLKYYRQMLRTQYDDPATVIRRQATLLRSVLVAANETIPFWKTRFEDAGIAPANLDIPDLQSLPILTKQDLREHGTSLLSPKYVGDDLHRHSTSGATGASVVTYRDEHCQQFKRAAVLRADEWSGWRLGQRIASVWGNPHIRTDWKGRLRNLLLDRRYASLDTLKMDEATISRFVDVLLRKPPSLLFGHAHSLCLLARFIRARRPQAVVRPNAIISTCMVLHDFERQEIEAIFGCRVTNRYGSEEVSLIASECERHEGLHVNSDCLFVEILDERGNPCESGQPGRVVVTDLTNRAMPLIRYELGDMATWASKKCSCGRTLPLLERVDGRVADYVITSRGEYISGISLTENFALQIPGVVQMQIVQEQINQFVYRIVKAPDFDEKSLATIARLTAERFGVGVAYDCQFVERILPEPSGKYRFCISRVSRNLGSERCVSDV